MSEAVIIEAVRTPFGKRKGVLRDHRPDSLLAGTLQALVQRAGLPAGKIEDVIAGSVSQAGEQSANVARLAVMLAGFPTSIAGVSLNRMCGSSQQAVHFAAQAVSAEDMKYAIGCGVESMTRVPMFLDLTLGKKDFTGFEDLNPDLFLHHALVHQVESAERIADHWKISRSQVDEFSIESHRRAQLAAVEGHHKELIEVGGVDPEGNPIDLVKDEGIRANIDTARMSTMNPVFRAPGTGVVTAANASQISDGASAVLVADRATALADGFTPRARFRARVVVGSDPVMQLTGVIPATEKALRMAGLSIADIDWFEINEAFASVVLAWAIEYKPDMEKVNPWGGAIAHGHPLGASGAGLMAKMLHGMEATGAQFGMQVMCIGHGQATATVIERI
ncbi:thiolase family protein [Hydrogenophaga sp. BPS33]|uniref:thiolase family protein n=1 Tax=Hydrogenophaga sp. BPS33 TaxID=2651974 RepID=UPI00131FE8CF|nr:thiolase family protein [Hydrogenophaga sp. BPS33]QHE84786.1 thiolase family protein [Hydrogenophaga sp. BPS33]